MSVMIFGDTKAMARAVVGRALDGRTGYCSMLREEAEAAVADYQCAYVRASEYDDQLTTNAVHWANGAKLGIPSLDPPVALHGLRAVLIWRQGQMEPEAFDKWMRHVVKRARPINAMAALDSELLASERGLSTADMAAW